MTLSANQLEAVRRAKERVAGTTITIRREHFEEEFEFSFLPTLNQPALVIVDKVQRLSTTKQASIESKFLALMDFMDAMATEETAELIGELGRAGIMSLGDLVDLQQEVVSAVASRPTGRSESSATGSQPTGSDSTGFAPPVASTPPS